MIIKNANVFFEGDFEKLDIQVKDGKFYKIEENITDDDVIIDLKDKKIIPGLIDLHTHGCIGYDFSTATVDEMQEMFNHYASCGVTSVAPTTITMEIETYKKSMITIDEYCNRENNTGARPIGINMEGPFLAKEKKGAHDERFLIDVNEDIFNELDRLSGNRILLVDLDPDLPSAMDFIKKYKDKKTISLAHTACSYDTAIKAIENGASHVTHLFNAMNGLHHREPGLVGAVNDKNVFAEIICDGVHIHPAVLRLMFNACPEKMVFVSDSMCACGLSDGMYELGGLKVVVKDAKATLVDGTIAGSTTTVYNSFKKAIEFGIDEEEAILSATLRPALTVGIEDKVGSIAKGKLADFVVVDDNYNIESVYIGGEKFK